MTKENLKALPDRVLKIGEAVLMTSLSRTEILNRVRDGGDFAPALKLGERRIGFLLSDVTSWLHSKKVAA